MAGRIKTGCFLGAEAALYLGFLALDLLRPGSGWALLLKYGAVALCFLAALDRAGTEDGRLVCAALAFTLAADWFLLIRDSFYLAGVACFCVVQAIYLLRLHRWGAGLLWPLRVGLTVAALAVAALLRALEPLTAVTLCYFAELACNTVSALRCSLWAVTSAWACTIWRPSCRWSIPDRSFPLPRWACGSFTCPLRC